MSEDLKKAMVKSRIAFMRKPETMFLSTVCFMLKLKYDPAIETGATNGTDLIIAPDFFMLLKPEMRLTLLAHETFHVVLQHCLVMKNFINKERFNHAADYVINCFLVEAGFMPISWTCPITGSPHTWLYDAQFKGMSTQQVYDLLPDCPKALNAMPGAAKGGKPVDTHLPPGGTNQDNKPMDEGEVRRTIVNIVNTAAAVATAGGQPGSIPSDVEVFLDKLKKPKLPLAHFLRKFFTAVARNDYTWQKLNRRVRPMLLPGMAGRKLTEIAFAYDMSCSVQRADTTRYQSELVGVMRNLRPDRLRLVQFDTEIKSDTKIRNLQDLAEMKLVGRGGTDINPLMEWAAKHKPTALVVFTDGEYSHPNINPGIPVLWVVHGRRRDQFHCNFGTTIRFEV